MAKLILANKIFNTNIISNHKIEVIINDFHVYDIYNNSFMEVEIDNKNTNKFVCKSGRFVSNVIFVPISEENEIFYDIYNFYSTKTFVYICVLPFVIFSLLRTFYNFNLIYVSITPLILYQLYVLSIGSHEYFNVILKANSKLK